MAGFVDAHSLAALALCFANGGKSRVLEIFGLYEGFVERGFQYPERDHFHLLACSFYTQSNCASITCHATPPVYVIEFSAY